MKRPLKIYGYAWVVLIAATIVTFAVMIIYPSHNELSADPYRIEKIVRVDLPDIASVQSMDNSGGGQMEYVCSQRTIHRGDFRGEHPNNG
jgi:hypothetical protein